MKFRYMAPIVWLMLVTCAAAVAAADGAPYRVERGDTLWDLSGHFWNDTGEWPELWARNPQISNPHRIFPGQEIWLDRQAPGKRLVRLPLEKLVPPTVPAPAAGKVGAGSPAPSTVETARGVTLGRPRAQDYVSSHRLTRLGSVKNVRQQKVAYGVGEDVEVALAAGARVAVDDPVTLVDDSVPVTHPVNELPQGYLVQVLGQGRVRYVQGDHAVVRIIRSYEVVEDGAGVITYRPPVLEARFLKSAVEVEGVVLGGEPGQQLFATEDVVFLDRGGLHGLQSGAVLEVPVKDVARSAEGVVRLGPPLARMVVVSVQDKTSTCLVYQSRATIEAGDRFVTAAVTP